MNITQRAREALSLARQKIEPHVRIDSLTNAEIDLLADAASQAALDASAADVAPLVEALKALTLYHSSGGHIGEPDAVIEAARQALSQWEAKHGRD